MPDFYNCTVVQISVLSNGIEILVLPIYFFQTPIIHNAHNVLVVNCGNRDDS